MEVCRSGLNLTRSETNWQFNCIMDNGISGSIEKPVWNWHNAESLEFLSGDESSVNESVWSWSPQVL